MRLEIIYYTGMVFLFGSVSLFCYWLMRKYSDQVQVLNNRYTKRYSNILKLLFYKIRPDQLFIIHVGVVFIFFFLGLFFGKDFLTGLISAFFFGIIGYFLVPTFLKVQLIKRKVEFNRQLQDALMSMANTLKTTPTLIEGFRMVSKNMTPPISQEFALLVKEYDLGLTLDEALDNLSKRVKSPNFDMALVSLSIGRTTGGNIPEILEQIAHVLREITRLEGLIDSKTAEGKMQAWVMGLLPVVLAFLTYIIDKNMIMPLFTTTVGYLLIVIILALETTGIILIRKITKIDI